MEIGSAAPTSAENLIKKLRIAVLESRTVILGEDWDLDLCSSFWRLYVNKRSGANLCYRGVQRPLLAGEIWLIPAWVRFQTKRSREVRQDYLHFDVRGLPPVFFRRIFDRPTLLQADPVLIALGRRWREGLEGKADFAHLCWAAALAQAAFASALSGWVEASPGRQLPGQEESERIFPAMERIESGMSQPPTNRELARLCGASEDYFIRQFRRFCGVTPSRYGRERRLAVAAEWLTTTDRSLEDIAEAAGFTDRFHFSRVFKVRFDQSPAAYRRMHRREFASLAVKE